jgi:hypothetical protein
MKNSWRGQTVASEPRFNHTSLPPALSAPGAIERPSMGIGNSGCDGELMFACFSPDASSGLICTSIGVSSCAWLNVPCHPAYCQNRPMYKITSCFPVALNPTVVHGSDPLQSPVIFGILMTVNPHYRRRNGPRTVKRPNAIGQAITVNRAIDHPSRPRPAKPHLYHFIRWGLSPLRRLKEVAR